MTTTLPPSAQLMDMIFAFTVSRAISVVAQFGLADQLKDGPKSATELATALGLHPRALYRLLRALASVGVFAEDAEQRFSLTPLSELLRSDAPESLRAFAAFQANGVNFQTWAALPYSPANRRTRVRSFVRATGFPLVRAKPGGRRNLPRGDEQHEFGQRARGAGGLRFQRHSKAG